MVTAMLLCEKHIQEEVEGEMWGTAALPSIIANICLTVNKNRVTVVTGFLFLLSDIEGQKE